MLLDVGRDESGSRQDAKRRVGKVVGFKKWTGKEKVQRKSSPGEELCDGVRSLRTYLESSLSISIILH